MSHSILKLDDALYMLLFDFNFRNQFAFENEKLSNISPEILKQLKTVEISELMSVSKKISNNIVSGNSQACGGLSSSFPLTFDSIGKSTIDVLIQEFIASEPFCLSCDIKLNSNSGICIEEAFYIFMRNNSAYTDEMLQSFLKFEAYKAVVSIYVHNKKPVFDTHEIKISKYNNSAYAVADFPFDFVKKIYPSKNLINHNGNVFVIFAATQKGLLHGPISDLSKAEGYLR